jgi:glycosyltransferase involved in cell wall biosynthesis
MRVAMIDPSLFTIPYDGALGAALEEAGCDVTLWGRAPRPHETLALATRFEPFFYRASERLAGRLPGGVWRLAKGAEHAIDLLRLARRFAGQPPDLVHVQWAPLPVVDRRLMTRFRRIAPTVLTVHDTTPFNGSPRSRAQAMGARDVFAAFDRLIVHTAAGKARLTALGIAAQRVAVIPHGVLPLPPTRGAAERSPAPTILLFGKIKPYKGLDVLVEAFGRLPPALRQRARLRVVGEPQVALAPIEARAAALGIADRIDWDLRYVADAEIGGIIASCDILAFPYRDIEASGVLMAALACGKPIVASALGAFAELLRDGEHGRLVAPDDADALAAALGDLLDDPARAVRMGEKVAALAAEVPDWRRIAASTIALYEELLRERRAWPIGAPAGAQLRP